MPATTMRGSCKSGWRGRGGRIKLHFISSYCPHLDPIERLWGLMHNNVTHNRCSAADLSHRAPAIPGPLSGLFSSPRRSLGQQRGNDHEVVGEHRGADKQREAFGAFGAAALHAAAAHQHRDASLDAGAEALALFERRRSVAITNCSPPSKEFQQIWFGVGLRWIPLDGKCNRLSGCQNFPDDPF